MPVDRGCTINGLILTAEEVRFFLSFCISRPLAKAADLLMGVAPQDELADQDHKNDIAEDLMDAAPIYENLRSKLVQCIRTRCN